jgi:hypothetical protein
VGVVLDALEEVGALNKTMVVLTSLTGALLGEFGMLTSSDVLKNPMLQVPLGVRMPGKPCHSLTREQSRAALAFLCPPKASRAVISCRRRGGRCSACCACSAAGAGQLCAGLTWACRTPLHRPAISNGESRAGGRINHRYRPDDRPSAQPAVGTCVGCRWLSCAMRVLPLPWASVLILSRRKGNLSGAFFLLLALSVSQEAGRLAHKHFQGQSLKLVLKRFDEDDSSSVVRDFSPSMHGSKFVFLRVRSMRRGAFTLSAVFVTEQARAC